MIGAGRGSPTGTDGEARADCGGPTGAGTGVAGGGLTGAGAETGSGDPTGADVEGGDGGVFVGLCFCVSICCLSQFRCTFNRHGNVGGWVYGGLEEMN